MNRNICLIFICIRAYSKQGIVCPATNIFGMGFDIQEAIFNGIPKLYDFSTLSRDTLINCSLLLPSSLGKIKCIRLLSSSKTSEFAKNQCIGKFMYPEKGIVSCEKAE